MTIQLTILLFPVPLALRDHPSIRVHICSTCNLLRSMIWIMETKSYSAQKLSNPLCWGERSISIDWVWQTLKSSQSCLKRLPRDTHNLPVIIGHLHLSVDVNHCRHSKLHHFQSQRPEMSRIQLDQSLCEHWEGITHWNSHVNRSCPKSNRNDICVVPQSISSLIFVS